MLDIESYEVLLETAPNFFNLFISKKRVHAEPLYLIDWFTSVLIFYFTGMWIIKNGLVKLILRLSHNASNRCIASDVYRSSSHIQQSINTQNDADTFNWQANL